MERFNELLIIYEELRKHFTPEPYSWLNYLNPFYVYPEKEPYILKAEFHPNYLDRSKSDDLISIYRKKTINDQNNVIFGNLYLLFERNKIKTFDEFNNHCKILENCFKSACNINKWNIKVDREIIYDEIIRYNNKDYDFATY